MYQAGARLAWAPSSSFQARPLIPGPARGERGLQGRPLRAAGLGAHLLHRVPSAEWPAGPRASEHTPPAPARGKLQLIRFFRGTFLRRLFALFCLVLEGRVGSRKANTKPSRRWGAGGRAGARSSAPTPAPASCRPPARVARLGGQLLYWHALRPEAGPCRPP